MRKRHGGLATIAELTRHIVAMQLELSRPDVARGPAANILRHDPVPGPQDATGELAITTNILALRHTDAQSRALGGQQHRRRKTNRTPYDSDDTRRRAE